jgi:hypothetical protein
MFGGFNNFNNNSFNFGKYFIVITGDMKYLYTSDSLENLKKYIQMENIPYDEIYEADASGQRIISYPSNMDDQIKEFLKQGQEYFEKVFRFEKLYVKA